MLQKLVLGFVPGEGLARERFDLVTSPLYLVSWRDLLSVLVVLGGGVKVWLPWFVVRRNLWPVVSFGIVSGHSFSPRCLGVWVSSRRCLVNSGGSFYLGAVS
ncbi:hypothetical protein Bca4012_096202 [Brassica carinata]|uniref:Uncharacterized protein n=1 Tax=Brassica carinata TaxID=52824 RepID=A0A8X7PXZ5_BRACI|nr:hypothetical protein Bca52824_078489 [Brassica carinata]